MWKIRALKVKASISPLSRRPIMPRFMPSMPFPPKSAMHVPPAGDPLDAEEKEKLE